MSDQILSYRPHDAGHDYYAPGIYLVTLVVRKRDVNASLFGTLSTDPLHPAVALSAAGQAVMDCWEAIPAFEAGKGRHVKIHAAVCMPDHFHGVIEVADRMDVSLGQVIWGFKVACTKRLRQLQQPTTAAAGMASGAAAGMGGEAAAGMGGVQPSLAGAPSGPLSLQSDLHRMSKRQRAEYYRLHPEAEQPLWDDNYDDTICLTDPLTGECSQRHYEAMVRYVRDNARRAIIRRTRPLFMQRCLHVRIDRRDYAAFGNLFLLRWARKVQVFCHRRDPLTHQPYELTEAYRNESERWEAMVMAGATVIVTPGISRGELLMKERCLKKGFPLIHLQKESIGRYWKPEAKRFEACANGSLLILAPWESEALGDVAGVPSITDYSIFHNLNTLAEEICRFDGEALIIRD